MEGLLSTGLTTSILISLSFSSGYYLCILMSVLLVLGHTNIQVFFSQFIDIKIYLSILSHRGSYSNTSNIGLTNWDFEVNNSISWYWIFERERKYREKHQTINPQRMLRVKKTAKKTKHVHLIQKKTSYFWCRDIRTLKGMLDICKTSFCNWCPPKLPNWKFQHFPTMLLAAPGVSWMNEMKIVCI